MQRSYNCSTQKWDDCLSKLTVQNKLTEVCRWECENKVWSRIQQGLPAGQFSFILRAASGTLPTPMKLNHWRYKADPQCLHCSSPHSTTLHILNACPSALSKGRYTWRHDSVLCQILDSLSLHLSSLGSLYGDIDGYRAIENPVATIPLDILVTSDCPDIVFISKDNSNTIIELHSLQCSRIFRSCSCSQN